MATLEIIEGPGAGRVYVVDRPSNVVGREGDCDVKLEDSRSSRRHAEIVRQKADSYLLRDLGSSNGTIVNGATVRGERQLRDGDEISVGQTKMVFILRGIAPAAEYLPEPETILQVMDTQALPLLSDDASPAGGVVKNLRFLLDLARVSEEASDLVSLAQALEDGLTKSIQADRVFLFSGKDEGMRPVERKLKPHLRRIYELPYSTSVVTQAAREKIAVMSNLREDERFRDARSVAAGQITAAICVPLIVGGELLGALYLDRMGEAEPFKGEELELASAAGLQCSVALLNIKRISELRESRDRLEAELSGPKGFVGEAHALRQVYDFIERASPTDAGVLILGESGTGKELIARAIHKSSPRVDRPFVIVNCAALAENLAEAELFGHERGAFTGADKSRPGRFLAADGGTIFLDEVGELSEPIQAKLLRVLEEGEITPVGEAGVRHIDVRVVAATNRDLARQVEEGKFRRDLYYRLNILMVELPPLRKRATDVPLLLRHFVRFFGERCGRPNMALSAEVVDLCLKYPWPGNVRELRNAVERMVILARGSEISPSDLPTEISGTQNLRVPGAAGGLRTLADVEREHIDAVLTQVNGNKKKAAEVLGIDRSTLYAKLKQYGIETP
jgi:transcriptional regulator with GAF, ATPase, and Fis domain